MSVTEKQVTLYYSQGKSFKTLYWACLNEAKNIIIQDKKSEIIKGVASGELEKEEIQHDKENDFMTFRHFVYYRDYYGCEMEEEKYFACPQIEDYENIKKKLAQRIMKEYKNENLQT